MTKALISALLCAATLMGAARCFAENGSPENKQVLATSPRALVEMLETVSFLTPADYQQKIDGERAAHVFPLGLEQLPQKLDEATDPRRGIKAGEMAAYAEVLTGFALESKRDGELLWGRIQGTQYERKTHQWLYQQLQAFGLEDVRYDKFPSQYPQWRPTTCELVVTSAPGFTPGRTHGFREAITAFISATTPPAGVEAEMVYVGDATPAELRGRDLTGKIVLLRGRTQPSAIISSARTAYSRLVEGSYGVPLGVVVWWDVPGTRQVAGRVGAPGGGDSIGQAVPWTTIGNDDGLYLRKLLDRASDETPVTVRLNVQGHMESGEQRMSGNVYAILPGQSGDYIVIPTHVDGYFYGIHDNGASVALNLALARYYAKIPLAQRAHGIIFLFQGDHEVPGVGGTLPGTFLKHLAECYKCQNHARVEKRHRVPDRCCIRLQVGQKRCGTGNVRGRRTQRHQRVHIGGKIA